MKKIRLLIMPMILLIISMVIYWLGLQDIIIGEVVDYNRFKNFYNN